MDAEVPPFSFFFFVSITCCFGATSMSGTVSRNAWISLKSLPSPSRGEPPRLLRFVPPVSAMTEAFFLSTEREKKRERGYKRKEERGEGNDAFPPPFLGVASFCVLSMSLFFLSTSAAVLAKRKKKRAGIRKQCRPLRPLFQSSARRSRIINNKNIRTRDTVRPSLSWPLRGPRRRRTTPASQSTRRQRWRPSA